MTHFYGLTTTTIAYLFIYIFDIFVQGFAKFTRRILKRLGRTTHRYYLNIPSVVTFVTFEQKCTFIESM